MRRCFAACLTTLVAWRGGYPLGCARVVRHGRLFHVNGRSDIQCRQSRGFPIGAGQILS